MKGRIFPILMVAAIISLVTGERAQSEEPDYGNDCNSAEPFEPNGAVVEGWVDPVTDEDWFSFSAAAESLYEVTFLSQSGVKNMRIYGPNGCGVSLEQIAAMSASTGSATEQVFIETGGTYYVHVDGSSGLYRFSAGLLGTYGTDTYNDTCDDPCVLVVGSGKSDGITDWGMDEDWFWFSTSILHKYQVSLDRPLNTDVVFDLYRSGCGEQLYSSATEMTFVSLDGQDYDLRVKSGSFSREGYYEVVVSDLGEQPDDHNNTCAGATAIPTNGDYVEGRLLYEADLFGDEDWFSFSGMADGLYECTFLSQSGMKTMRIYGPDGCGGSLQQIAAISADTGGVTEQVFTETAGTYYVQPLGSGGLYRLSVSFLGSYGTDSYGNTCDDPCMLAVDGAVMLDGIGDWGMDEDWLTFDGNTLHKYEISFFRPLNTDVVFDLYESGCGDQLHGGAGATITLVPWYDERYDLRFRSASFNKEGYYEIWVSDLGKQTDDHGNTPDAATPIGTGGIQVSGDLGEYAADVGPDSEDWLSFAADAAGIYTITLSGSSCGFMGSGPYTTVVLYGPDGSGGLQTIKSFNTFDPVQEIFLEGAAAYYLRVTACSPYSLSVLAPVPQCGDINHPYPPHDLTEDCIVNFKDLAMLAGHWLEDNSP